jgi:hypothetical protein
MAFAEAAEESQQHTEENEDNAFSISMWPTLSQVRDTPGGTEEN